MSTKHSTLTGSDLHFSKIKTASGSPNSNSFASTTGSLVGDIYMDTDTQSVYVRKALTGSNDWAAAPIQHIGNHPMIFTTTGATSITLPTTGTLLTNIAGSIPYSLLNLSNSVTNADLAGNIAASKLVALTASRAVVSDASGFISPSATTSTEIGFVSGVTSAIQTQLNSKQATGSYITGLTGHVVATGPGSVSSTIQDGVVTSAMITDLTIVNGDISASAAIADTKLATIATPLKVSNSATTATSGNVGSSIVARDAFGDFNSRAQSIERIFISGSVNNGDGFISLGSQIGNPVGQANYGRLNATNTGQGLLFTKPNSVFNHLDFAASTVSRTYSFPNVSGNIVLDTATQTLTNKTLTSPLINTPSGIVKGDVGLGNVDNTSDATKNSASATLLNKVVSSTGAMTGALTLPSGTVANRSGLTTTGMIRHNTDANEFEGYSNGTWASVGGGLNEQPVKNYLKSYATANVAPGATTTLAVAGAITTTLSTFYADATTGAAGVTSSASTVLRGGFNYLSALSGASGTGTAFFQLPAFALEGSDLGKPVSISFDINSALVDGDWDVVVVRYNSAGTHQSIISVAGNASGATATPSAKLPTGTAQFNGFFIPDSTTASDLYALRFRRILGTAQIRIDSLFVGNQPARVGAAVTDWQSYTPSIFSDATNKDGDFSSRTARYRRVGANIEVEFYLFRNANVASSGGPTTSISLPLGITPDLSSLEYALLGTFAQPGSPDVVRPMYRGAGKIEIGDYGSGLNYTTAFGTASADSSGRFSAQITGWSSNVTMADRAVEEYAFNTNTATGGDTGSFGYGITGSVVPAVAQSLTANGNVYRVRFQTPIQPTDKLHLEFQSPGGLAWFDVGSQTQGAIQPFNYNNAKWYGVFIESFNSTDVNVFFGLSGANNTGAYGSATSGDYASWVARNSSGYRYRVRKVSGGAQVGFPVSSANIVGRTDGVAVAAGYVGEVREALQSSFVNFATTTQWADGASILLQPGNYAVSTLVTINLNGATSTLVASGISTSTGNAFADVVNGSNQAESGPPGAAFYGTLSIPSYIVRISVATTYYLKVRSAYSAGTPQYTGRITAIRIA